MLNLPEIMPIETVLAMAKIPFDTTVVKTTESSQLQKTLGGFSILQDTTTFASGKIKLFVGPTAQADNTS